MIYGDVCRVLELSLVMPYPTTQPRITSEVGSQEEILVIVLNKTRVDAAIDDHYLYINQL
jgi:hypothetical protein